MSCKLMEIKEAVEEIAYDNMDSASVKQMGELVDMIKDLSKAIYYDTIVDSMWEDGTGTVHEEDNETEEARMAYLTAKSNHLDNNTRITKLNAYLNDVSEEMTDTLTGITPEEKQVVVTKLTHMVQKAQSA